MAVNVRLRPDQAEALREASARLGRSQQELMRESIDAFLGRAVHAAAPLPDWVDPPTQPYASVKPRLTLPTGQTSTQILDQLRSDRL